jgi:hypothetical protein
MKKVAVLTSIVLSLTGMHGARAAGQEDIAHQKKTGARSESKRPFSIRVTNAGWGNAKPEEIEMLLNAVAAELLTHFPGRRLDPIVVSPANNGPIVLYQKGPQNEYQVLLAAKGDHWAEYVYEFSHELFHILAHYEYHAPPHTARHQWFEETLCETVSLYMLKRFSLTWEQSPPKAEWRSYAPDLYKFTERALNDPNRQLPRNVSFEQWFKENGPILATKPYLREKNDLVASLFLPLFEQMPDWRAIAYLNLDVPQGESSFRDHLAHWYRKTPSPHKQFVGHAMSLFHFKEPVDSDRLLTFDKPVSAPMDASEVPAGSAGRAAQ